MSKIKFDVLIAGAGPAGCAAAIKLRQYGLEVAMVDEVSDEQLKVGESLPGATVRLLKDLGIQGINALLSPDEFHPCTANASAWGTDHWTFRDAILNPEGGGWHILRHRFDAALRQVAKDRGVHFFSAKVASVHQNFSPNFPFQLAFKKQGPGLPENLQAKYLIDATGRANVICKQLGIKRKIFDEQLAAVSWLKSAPDDLDQTTRIKSVANGWWYTARLPNGLRVLAFHGAPAAVAPLIHDAATYLDLVNETDLLPATIGVKDLVKGPFGRRAGISKLERVGGHNWLAVGDAALSFDPLSSQGVFFALYSGLRGAETLWEAMQSPESSEELVADYGAKVERVFAENQRSQRYFYRMI